MKVLRISIIVLSGIIIPSIGTAYAQYGCPPIEGGWHPQIATYGDNVYVSWNYFYDCGERILIFDKSQDGGTSFSSRMILATSSFAGSPAAMAAGNGRLFVSWIKYGSPQELFLKASADNGTTFGKMMEVGTNGTVQSNLSDIVVSADNVGIIWTGIPRQGERAVFLSESTDGGRVFGSPVDLSATTGDSFGPKVVQQGGKAYVIWSSFGSCNSGRHPCTLHAYFTTIDVKNDFLVGKVADLGSMTPALAASGSNVYVAGVMSKSYTPYKIENGMKMDFPPIGNQTIVFLKSPDGGKTFDNMTSLGTYDESTDHINDLTVDASGRFVYVTWYDFHSQQRGADVIMAASSDGGDSFGRINAVDANDTGNTGNGPDLLSRQISASGSRYYASWLGHTGLDPVHQGAFIRTSSDGGQTFDQITDLTRTIEISNPEHILVSDGSRVYIAGPDYAFKDGNHIMFSSSTDGGNSFSPQIDLDQNSISDVPEFYGVMPVLLIAVTAIIIIYRVGARK